MKTEIDDGLLRELRELASEQGRSERELLDEAALRYLRGRAGLKQMLEDADRWQLAPVANRSNYPGSSRRPRSKRPGLGPDRTYRHSRACSGDGRGWTIRVGNLRRRARGGREGPKAREAQALSAGGRGGALPTAVTSTVTAAVRASPPRLQAGRRSWSECPRRLLSG